MGFPHSGWTNLSPVGMDDTMKPYEWDKPPACTLSREPFCQSPFRVNATFGLSDTLCFMAGLQLRREERVIFCIMSMGWAQIGWDLICSPGSCRGQLGKETISFPPPPASPKPPKQQNRQTTKALGGKTRLAASKVFWPRASALDPHPPP